MEPGIADEMPIFERILSEITELCSDVIKLIEKDTTDIHKIEELFDSLTLDPKPFGQKFTFHPLECAVMRLDSRVLRNVIKVTTIPMLCNNSSKFNIERKHKSMAKFFDITMLPSRTKKFDYELVINPAYCEPPHPIVGVPLAVMAHKASYMWLGKSGVST